MLWALSLVELVWILAILSIATFVVIALLRRLHCAFGRRSGVAACGSRAAVDDAGDWIFAQRFT